MILAEDHLFGITRRGHHDSDLTVSGVASPEERKPMGVVPSADAQRGRAPKRRATEVTRKHLETRARIENKGRGGVTV